MSLPEPVGPSSGLSTITAQGPAASAGAETSFPCGAGSTGPTCVYFGGEQGVLIPVEDLVWA